MGEERRTDQQTSLNVDYTPSKLLTTLTCIVLTIDWLKFMVMFNVYLGSKETTEHLWVPAFEMLLLMGGRGSETQIAQNYIKGGMDQFLSTMTVCQQLFDTL